MSNRFTEWQVRNISAALNPLIRTYFSSLVHFLLRIPKKRTTGKRKMRRLKLVIAAFLIVSPFSANAGLIEIAVVPSEGAWFTMTGSFEYDAGTQVYSNLTVNITGDIGPFSFNDTACDSCPLSGSGVGLIDPTLTSNFFLSDFSVQWAGGAITAIFRGNSFQLDEPNGRLDGTYSLQAAASVPEPGTLALFGIGLFGIALARRKTKV